MSISQWKKSKPLLNPRTEQLRGMGLIVAGDGARLFLHPGKGKTATVLKAFQILKEKNMVDCLLVIAPLRVITTSWPAQIEYWEDFTDLTYAIVHGDRSTEMAKDVDVYLMNLEGLIGSTWCRKKTHPVTKKVEYLPTKEVLDFLKSKRVMLAVDESTKFKNPQSERFKQLKRYLGNFLYPVIMTGTPQPNDLEDLFAQCYITDQGKDLGQFITHFRRDYMQPKFNGFGFEPRLGAAEKVAAKIAPTTLQLEYEEALPSQIIQIWVPMPDHIKAPYEELRKEFITTLGDAVVMAPNTGVLLGKLKQMAQGAIYIEGGGYMELHTAKLDALDTLLEELNGVPAFCLYQYLHDAERIQQRHSGTPRVGGGISAAQGALYCQAFGAGALPLLLGHPQSVSHGIDGLQNSCNNVIWFGIDHSWENFYQGNLRIVREGNKHDQVFIYQILMDCPSERAILASLNGKQTSEADFCRLLREYMK